MIEIGIPVWKARDTIEDTLNSLVAQTRKRFFVCLSIDGDNDDYADIISKYRSLGLIIRVVTGENGGPGIARQRILDTTQCEYLMFLDADDLLMPQAIDSLYNIIKANDYDIVRSSFIRENPYGPNQFLKYDIETITWFHGKVYKVDYLKKNNIHFYPGLRADEDAFFNLIAWNCAEKRGSLDETTYYWRYNKKSITRKNDVKQYFSDTYIYYVTSQIEGLKEIYRIKNEVNELLITYTLINVYDYYMQAKFYNLPLEPLDELILTLADKEWIKKYFHNGQNWIDISNKVKASKIIDSKYIIFYEENFATWAKRLFKYDKQ